MAVETERLSPAEHLERRIAQNLVDAERWRAEHGDPAEALGAFLREWIGSEALQETYEEYRRNRYDFKYEDDAADEDEDEDGREPR